MKKYSASLFMLSLGLFSLVVHFLSGWVAYQDESQQHLMTAHMNDYVIRWIRDVFENLQSEFLQLFFQFMLIAGAFEFFRVYVYEKDIADLSDKLDRIEKKL